MGRESLLQGGEVVIVEAARTPIGRGHRTKGRFRDIHPDALLGASYTAVIERAGIDPELVEDVVSGAVTQVGEQSNNIARNAWLQAGLPATTPVSTVDRDRPALTLPAADGVSRPAGQSAGKFAPLGKFVPPAVPPAVFQLAEPVKPPTDHGFLHYKPVETAREAMGADCATWARSWSAEEDRRALPAGLAPGSPAYPRSWRWR